MSAYYAKLERESLLHITGPDSLGFLQGQTTCDTRPVDGTLAVPGAFCTPQGRMVCDFLLAQLGADHFALRLRADTLETANSTFGKYIVFSKAELDGQRDDWQIIACWGDGASQALADSLGEIPSSQFQAVCGDGYVVIQLDEQGQQFEAWIDTRQHEEHYQALQQAMTASDEEHWFALQILAGRGRVEGPTIEEFLPQMLNYDLTGHISFNKGCYTGQEIVARLHYRGTAKRRLYLATGGSEILSAGTPLFKADSTQSIGNIVNSGLDKGTAVHLVSSTEAGLDTPLHPESPDSPIELALTSLHQSNEES